MTETVSKDEGEFVRIIDKVRFSTTQLRVDTAGNPQYDVLFVVSAKDLIEAARKDAPKEIRDNSWFIKWLGTS